MGPRFVSTLFTTLAVVLSPCLPAARGQAQRSPAEWGALAARGDLLVLAHGELDPRAGLPALPAELAWTPGEPGRPDYAIVQLERAQAPEDRAAIEALGGEILAHVPNRAWLVRGTPAELVAVARLERVRAALPLPPAFRVDPAALRVGGGEPRAWALSLFEGEDGPAAVEALLAAGATVSEWDGGGRIEARAEPALLPRLARIRAVAWIQEAPVLELRANDRTTWVLQSNLSGQTPLWDRGIRGEGQIAGHIDDPLDLGNCYFHDPAAPSPGPAHRKVVVHNGGTSSSGDHGAHTAGTLAGDREPTSGSSFRNGIAYRARIAHTNLSLVGSGNLAARLQELFDAGARVFSNSWGNDGTSAYDALARDIDVFSRQNEDALVLFAVSNLPVLRNPENAKNVLAVGATSQAPSQANHCTGGAGPTQDGRRKPEIYVPGCGIQSADAGTSCGTRSLSGTSMACPAVTGAAALVRQYFEEGWHARGVREPGRGFAPSGALVKAVLLNAAVDMTGVPGYPSYLEGWGRLLLEDGVHFQGDARRLCVADVRRAQGFRGPGGRLTWGVEVASASVPLEITLAWHDEPAALLAALTPVNDLDLRVTAPDGTVYPGNLFSGGQSSSGLAADTLNNVERVRRDAPQAGLWRVEVRASSVPMPDQGFGLAVTGDLGACLSPQRPGGQTGTPGRRSL